MKTGKILVALQLMGMFGCFVEEGRIIPEGRIMMQVGYCLPGIIGIILIIKSLMKKTNKQIKEESIRGRNI